MAAEIGKGMTMIDKRTVQRLKGATLGELLYVIAGRHDDARDFAKSKGKTQMQLRFVYAPEQIYGLRNITAHVLPNASDLKGFDRIMQEAQIRGFDVVNV